MEYYDDNENENTESEQPNTGFHANNAYDNNGRQPKPVKEPNKMAMASLICGLTGMISLCFCIAFPLTIILGVAAICFSFFSKKGQPFTGQAVAGLVLGILAVIFGLAAGFYLIFMSLVLSDPNMAPILNQMEEMIQQITPTQ